METMPPSSVEASSSSAYAIRNRLVKFVGLTTMTIGAALMSNAAQAPENSSKTREAVVTTPESTPKDPRTVSLEADLAQYTKQIKEEPANWYFLYLRAKVLQALGRSHEALADYERAMPLKELCSNHSTEILVHRAPLLVERGEYQRALEDCGAALADTFCAVPREHIFRLRGGILRHLGRTAEAQKDLAEAERLEVAHAEHLKRLDEDWKKKYPNWPKSVD